MSPIIQPKANASPPAPRVLVVDDEPGLIELVTDVFKRSHNCRVMSATSIAQAMKIIATEKIDLLLADVHLPDGNGLALLPRLREKQPAAATVMITGNPSISGTVSAFREGVVDFLPKPFTADHLLERLNTAIARQAKTIQKEVRLSRLRGAVKKLNVTRHIISKKVDLLCNDLVSAYGELSRQLDTVRNQEGFRKLVNGATDLEQLLCHAMDWILRNAGYCNVAVWLASEEQAFELGAYMKYTIPGEPELTSAMKQGLVPMINRQGNVHLYGAEAREQLTPAELKTMSGQEVVGVNCTYLGESLAVVVMFRDEKCPFTDEDIAMVRGINSIFAIALANIVRRSQEGAEELEDQTDSDADGPLLDDDSHSQSPKPNKSDSADWWKRGESPPF